MKYTVVAAIKTESFTTEHGTFDKYALQLKDEAGAAVQCYINQKNTSPAPNTGEELNGTIEADNRGGMKFKKEQAFGGSGGGRYNDPATRKEIIRQSSLAQAVAYCTAKATYMEREEALKYLSGQHIVQVATSFAAYAEGRWTVKTTREEAIALFETEGSYVKSDEEQKETPAQAAEQVFDQKAEEYVKPEEVPF